MEYIKKLFNFCVVTEGSKQPWKNVINDEFKAEFKPDINDCEVESITNQIDNFCCPWESNGQPLYTSRKQYEHHCELIKRIPLTNNELQIMCKKQI